MKFKKVASSSFPSLDGLVKVVLLLMGIVLGSESAAQGWEANFGGANYDEGTAMVEAVDGGFILVGFSESFGSDNDLDVYVVRTDIDGVVLWNRVYDPGFMEHGFGVLAESDGSILVVGDINSRPEDPLNVLLYRLTKEGKLIWSKHYESEAREVGKDLVRTSDGGYLIIGSTEATSDGNDDILLMKVNAEGELLWRKQYGEVGDDRGEALVTLEDGFAFVANSDNPNGFDNDVILYRIDKNGEKLWSERIASTNESGGPEADKASDLILTREGKLVIAGSRGFSSDAWVAQYNLDGNLIWEKTIGGDLGDEATCVVEIESGALVFGGATETSESNLDMLMFQLSATGEEMWRSVVGSEDTYEDCREIVATSDGKFATVGLKSDVFKATLNDIILVRTDDLGNTITNYIQGRVYRDADAGCNGYDLTRDAPLKDWLVQVSSKSTDRIYFGTTDTEGKYSIRVDTGNYEVKVLPVNNYWSSCVENGYEINLTEFYDTTTLGFPIVAETICPYLEVDISTPFLAACSDIVYSVDYCNIGTGAAQDAYVEVTLSDELNFLSSSIPVAAQDGNVYTFNIGNLASSECGSFTINTELPCSGIAEGQAALASAEIFPNVLCVEPDPNWDGASVIVSGNCTTERDSVIFNVTNAGDGNMNQPSNYIVIQDDLILFQDDVQLPAGVGERVALPVNAGATYRVIAEQTPFHPGRTYPTAFVEGCVEEGAPFSTGFATQFPENDLDPGISIDVQEIVGSNSSVELRGYPKGYGDSSLVASNTDITYTVFFRNTGTDTINRLVIRDTLSSQLDITTVTPGASNLPYEFEVYDNGILKFTFSDIELLPGGSDGDASSYGFVKFRVSQKPDNPAGTAIENRAVVYFDYLEPEKTNWTRYFVGQFPSYITTDVEKVFYPGVKINVYPNPFIDSTVFDIEGYDFKEVILNVFDSSGRLLHTSRHTGNQIMYYRNALPSGLYFFRLESEGKPISSGKLLVR